MHDGNLCKLGGAEEYRKPQLQLKVKLINKQLKNIIYNGSGHLPDVPVCGCQFENIKFCVEFQNVCVGVSLELGHLQKPVLGTVAHRKLSLSGLPASLCPLLLRWESGTHVSVIISLTPPGQARDMIPAAVSMVVSAMQVACRSGEPRTLPDPQCCESQPHPPPPWHLTDCNSDR